MKNTDGQLAAKRRLGRGLNVLLGGGSTDVREPRHNLKQIDVNAIERNPYQPRRDFGNDELDELVKSIRQHGVLQPLLVRPRSDGYQLIAGERRWMAGKRAGLHTVPCRVLELDDQRVCEVAIEENLKRKDLNVLEKAQAFQNYLDRFETSVEQLAQQLSMDRSTVSNLLRLLELSEPVKLALSENRITNGHARALLPLEEADQIALCLRVQEESLSVRKTEVVVRATLRGDVTLPFRPPAEARPGRSPTNHVISLQDQLRDLLGARVDIRLRGEESGKIVIQFKSNDEFERILHTLRRIA